MSAPWPPRSAARIVVFGGTFDPPHRWHLAAARAARAYLFGPRGWIVFVPAARSPLKSTGPAAADAARVEMLRVATSRLSRSTVWTGELQRPGPSYTIDTLREVRSRCPRATLRLLIGADQAAAFHRWREFREVMFLAEPAVVLRPPIGTASALRRVLREAGVWTEDDIEAWVRRVVPLRTSAIASTDLRRSLKRIRGRQPGARLKAAIPVAVLRYIVRNGLYGAGRKRKQARGSSTPGERHETQHESALIRA